MSGKILATIQGFHTVKAGDRICHSDWDFVPHGFWGRDRNIPTRIPNLRRCKQVHGTLLSNAADLGEGEFPEGDGLYCTKPNITCLVQTADCLPVLFFSKRLNFAAAVHAGWRGLTNGILANAVAEYEKLGAADDLMVGIGPAISCSKFEVGPEVIEAVRKSSMGLVPDQIAAVVSPGVGDRWHLDLATAAALQMVNCKIPAKQIYKMDSCTYLDQIEWHSFRREGKGCPMNHSWICLKSPDSPE